MYSGSYNAGSGSYNAVAGAGLPMVAFWAGDVVRKTPFGAIFTRKNNNLPRQAWDKRNETLKNGPFAGGSGPRTRRVCARGGVQTCSQGDWLFYPWPDYRDCPLVYFIRVLGAGGRAMFFRVWIPDVFSSVCTQPELTRDGQTKFNTFQLTTTSLA